MTFRINSKLDTAALAKTYKAEGRVQIRDFLEAASADEMYASIHENVIWDWAYFEGTERKTLNGRGMKEMIARRQSELMHKIYLQARTDYQQLLFECRLDEDASVQSTKDPAKVSTIAEFLLSDEFGAAMNAVTGSKDAKGIDDIHATWTNRDHFRNDTGTAPDKPESGAMFMLDLAKDWRANWGGAMMFPNDDGGIDECWVPSFNSLSIIAAPARHAITYVTSYSEGFRLSVWGHAK